MMQDTFAPTKNKSDGVFLQKHKENIKVLLYAKAMDKENNTEGQRSSSKSLNTMTKVTNSNY